jgi:hypothetical protein
MGRPARRGALEPGGLAVYRPPPPQKKMRKKAAPSDRSAHARRFQCWQLATKKAKLLQNIAEVQEKAKHQLAIELQNIAEEQEKTKHRLAIN